MTEKEKQIINKFIEYENLEERMNALYSNIIGKLELLDSLKLQLEKVNSAEVNRIKKEKEDIQKIIEEKSIGFPWLADVISQYYESRDLKIAEFMEKKLRPGISSAERIKELAAEKREFQRKFIIARNISKYYETLFPWITEFVDQNIDETIISSFHKDEPQEDQIDPVQSFLTDGEFKKLSTTERNQLALDRYWKKKKTSWEIGRDYERFVGYLYEKDGWSVYYQGIFHGREDLGRDLICKKENLIEIVQCKNWRKDRTIYVNHINQLFGTTIEYYIENIAKQNSTIQFDLFDAIQSGKLPKAKLIASCTFSDEARSFAQTLGVQIVESFNFNHYPSIKCNVSRKDNEKIYHLPFDQQYDRTTIEEERNEYYVSTVHEAEKLGFRRAWRWRGSEKNQIRK